MTKEDEEEEEKKRKVFFSYQQPEMVGSPLG